MSAYFGKVSVFPESHAVRQDRRTAHFMQRQHRRDARCAQEKAGCKLHLLSELEFGMKWDQGIVLELVVNMKLLLRYVTFLMIDVTAL